MSKSAAVVLAFAGFMLFSIPMSAQDAGRHGGFNGLLPNGNVYAGVSYGKLTDQINSQSYHGFEGSFEALPFTRFRHLGLVADGSGFFRKGVTQYVIVGGPRISGNYGRWRPFVQAMAGIRHVNSYSFVYNPIAIDVGGGVDYRLGFKNFSWRLQGDFVHSNYGSAQQNDYHASTGIVWRF